ncbi:MAG: hypothetical protein ACOX7B_15530 [Christensenellales bacterium]|jgi:hypothetical protein
MRRKWAAVILCVMLWSGLGQATAGDAQAVSLTMVSEWPLIFSREPVRIEKSQVLPNGNVAVFYFAQGASTGEEVYWLEVFTAIGERVLAKQLAAFTPQPDGGMYPYAQIWVERNQFVCEYYPDITRMEVCYRSVYTLDGKIVKKEKKSTLTYGDAFYAYNVGPYILKRQAHAYDEEHADPFIALEIVHVPTGNVLKTKA